MTINHLNLPVRDVPEVLRLFESYLGFNCREIKGDHGVVVLDNSDGFTLVLMPMSKKGSDNYPELFHIGVLMDDASAVQQVYQKLKSGGVPLPAEPGKIRDGYGFYFKFDALMVEIALK